MTYERTKSRDRSVAIVTNTTLNVCRLFGINPDQQLILAIRILVSQVIQASVRYSTAIA